MFNKKNSIQQNKKSTTNQDSGSAYHREHAGNVEGYGETEPYVQGLSTTSEKENQ